MNNSTETNIIYMTNSCNIGCKYCYEDLSTVKVKNTSKDELMNIADTIISREEDFQSYFGLFGGEPTLRWEECKFFMDYVYGKKKNVHFGITSNGIRFLDNDFYNDFIKNKHFREGRLSLDISFDGKGNQDRVYKDGKSTTEELLFILSRFKEDNIKYRLRYTINKNNLSLFERDIPNLVQNFNPLRVIITETSDDFDLKEKSTLSRGKSKLMGMWNNQEIEIPLCELVCDTCNGCDLNRSTHSYFIKDKNIKEESYKTGSFNHFEKE